MDGDDPTRNSSILWLFSSPIQRLPDESKVGPLKTTRRRFNLFWDRPEVPVVKSDCPSTIDAALFVVSGALYSSVLLLDESATQRFPVESNAIPCGTAKLVADGVLPPP